MHCNMKLSFDYLVGAGLQRRWHIEKKKDRLAAVPPKSDQVF
jgi:hypothetical protein